MLALKHPERKRIEAQTLHTTPQVGSLGAGRLSVRVAYPVRRGPVGSRVTGKEADSPEASSPDQREQRACAPIPVHVCRASQHPERRAAGASTDSGALALGHRRRLPSCARRGSGSRAEEAGGGAVRASREPPPRPRPPRRRQGPRRQALGTGCSRGRGKISLRNPWARVGRT